MSTPAAGGARPFDALLFLSFGGPEGPDDVIPFLENVTRGRGVPPERLAEVAEHYHHFDGVSPINRLNLEMIEALKTELAERGRQLPVYFGNRNWHPMVEDTLAQMYRDGHRRILAFATSAWGGYSGCRQYHEDIDRAVAALAEREPGSRTDPVTVRKLPHFADEPAFAEAGGDAIRRAVAGLPPRDGAVRLVCTAHSVPVTADENSGPASEGGRLYSRQVADAAAAAAAAAGFAEHDTVWQSRSGPPQIPWLEPDVCDHIAELPGEAVEQVVVYPVGFISDHLEVIWDLDNEAAEAAREAGLDFVRADSVGTDPRFIRLVADLVERYADGGGDLTAMGCGDNGTLCRPDCCAVAPRRPAGTGR